RADVVLSPLRQFAELSGADLLASQGERVPAAAIVSGHVLDDDETPLRQARQFDVHVPVEWAVVVRLERELLPADVRPEVSVEEEEVFLYRTGGDRRPALGRKSRQYEVLSLGQLHANQRCLAGGLPTLKHQSNRPQGA